MASNQIYNRVTIICAFLLPEIAKPLGMYYLGFIDIYLMLGMYLTSVPLWFLVSKHIYELYLLDKKLSNTKNDDKNNNTNNDFNK